MLRRHNREIEVVVTLGNFCTEQGGKYLSLRQLMPRDPPTGIAGK